MKIRTIEPSYHHGNLHQGLIDAALGLIASEGAQALTLRAVARKAGVSHAAPYRHFADKEALLVAVAEEGFQRLSRSMAQRMECYTDPLARFLQSGVGYVLFAVAHPAHFRVMFSSAFSCQEPPPGLRQAGEAALAVLTNAITGAQMVGQLNGAKVESISATAWSLVHGLASLLIDQQFHGWALENATPVSLAETTIQLMIDGLNRPTLSPTA